MSVRARVVSGLLDQAATAAVSFLAIALAARSLGATGLGTFAIFNGTYVLLQVIEQALVSEATVIGESGRGQRVHAVWLGTRRGSVLALGLALAGAGVSLALTGDWAGASVFCGAAFAGMAADIARGVLIAVGRPAVLATASIAGLLTSVVAFVTLQPTSVAGALLAWSVAFAPGLALWAHGTATSMLHRDSARSQGVAGASAIKAGLLGEAVAAQGAAYALLLLVDAYAGRPETGVYRLALAVVGPVSVLFNVVRLYGVSEVRRRSQGSPMALATAVAALCVLMALAFGLVLWAVPDVWMRSLLGPGAWTAVAPTLTWAVAHRAAIGLTLGPAIVLRASLAVSGPLFARLAGVVVTLLFAVTVVHTFGASGALMALAAGALTQAMSLGVIVWRRSCVRT